MRYRNSECCITPEELAQDTVRTDGLSGCGDNSNWNKRMDWNRDDKWNDRMDWNRKDGWSMRDKYDTRDKWNKNDKCYDKDNCKKHDKCDDNDNWKKHDKCDDNDNCNNDCDDLMRRLTELQFAAIDLNLFLDTHPCDEAALEMFKKVMKTIESVKMDYIRKYGPLKAGDSADEVPFQWASYEFKWPWEK